MTAEDIQRVLTVLKAFNDADNENIEPWTELGLAHPDGYPLGRLKFNGKEWLFYV